MHKPTNGMVAARAAELAKASGKHWGSLIREARDQLEQLPSSELAKMAPSPAKPLLPDSELKKRAAISVVRNTHRPGIGDPTPPRERLVIGEVETKHHGRLHVEIDQGASAAYLHLQDIHVPVADLDRDLRDVLFATAAAFAAAQRDEEQTTQRALVGLAVQAALDRHKWLSARVREQADRIRFGN